MGLHGFGGHKQFIYLILDAGLVEAIAADGASIGTDVPRPHRDGIPLLNLESWRQLFCPCCQEQRECTVSMYSSSADSSTSYVCLIKKL